MKVLVDRVNDVIHYAHLRLPTITDTTRAIIIDKSSANYPHDPLGGDLILKELRYDIVKSLPTDIWQINIGVVTENDGTDGTVNWFHHSFDYSDADQVTISDTFSGSVCIRVLGGETDCIMTKHAETHADWSTAGALKSSETTPSSGTPTFAAGVGDLVVKYELVSGTGNLNKNTLTVSYSQV